MQKMNMYLTTCGPIYCFEVGRKQKKIGWIRAFLIAGSWIALMGFILGDALPSLLADLFLWP